MTNNFEHIKSIMSFDNENDFYHIQILKRRKENPDLSKGTIVIKNFYVKSFEEYDANIPHIIHMCTYENARAYIRVNKRNYRVLAHKMNKMLANYMEIGQYKTIGNIFDKCIGRYPSDPDKKWVIDIDFENNETEEEKKKRLGYIMLQTQSLQSETKVEPLTFINKTPNGVHLITRPFNIEKFNKLYPKIDLHKDRLSLLFIP